MNNRRIKYIMELVFIFILPLLFLLPCIKIKDNYVYDNEGNYQVSEKQIDFDSPLNLTTQVIETKTFYDKEFYVSEYADEDIYLNLRKLYNEYANMWIAVNGIDLIGNNIEIMFDSYVGGFNGSIEFEDGVGGSEIADLDNPSLYYFYTNVETDEFIILVNCEYFYNFLDERYLIDTFIGEGYFSIYRDVENTYNVITEEEDLNLFGQIKQLIVNNLHIEDSFLIDLIITYVFLWFVMFIIWHLFYLLLDFLLHFWRKEEK